MNINFEDLNNIPLKNFITQNQVWVYCDDERGTKWNPTNYDNPEFYRRFFLTNGGLIFNRFKNDENADELRPRIELCYPKQRLRKEKLYRIKYIFELIQIEGFRGVIFQIMDKTLDGRTLPVKQLELRDGKLHSRWTEIRNGENYNTHIKEIAKAEVGKLYNIEMEIFLSADPNKAYCKTFLDNKLVHDLKGINASANVLGCQIQIGIYSVKGFNLKTKVKELSWR